MVEQSNNPVLSVIANWKQEALLSLRVIRKQGPSQAQFWVLAVFLGLLGGGAAVLFRQGIEAVQALVYQTDNVAWLYRNLDRLDWYWIVLIPTLGGLCVGIILDRFTQDGRVRSVADVIEGSALNQGRVEVKEGAASALASFITLSTGGSSGREGPVVHLASVIATITSKLIRADGVTGRDLLGCAVAAAVSASFNAPIAGALFALEVVLRHFAVHAFAPIAIASVTGAIISRLAIGDSPEFTIFSLTALRFYAEIPAFMILGLICGLVAYAQIRTIFFADHFASAVQSKLHLPRFLRPATAGLLLGVIALAFPHIIGVGYGTTADALFGRLGFWAAILFVGVKIIAVAITMGGRMGGGVFSPSLMIGALTGLAFGILATSIFPDQSGSATLYALAGMGAVAASVLGAPISTTLIVFELTGDWQTGLAVMVTVSLATALTSRLVDRSFFLTQLERRDVHLAAGPQAYLLSTFKVTGVMRQLNADVDIDEAACAELIAKGIYVETDDTLDKAMPLFEQSGSNFLPVVNFSKKEGPPELRGAVFHVDALGAFNRALAAVAAEEHS